MNDKDKKDKEDIDNLFKAVRMLNEIVHLLSERFNSEEISRLVAEIKYITKKKGTSAKDTRVKDTSVKDE